MVIRKKRFAEVTSFYSKNDVILKVTPVPHVANDLIPPYRPMPQAGALLRNDVFREVVTTTSEATIEK